MSNLQDPIRAGLARGWKVHGETHLPLPDRLQCDVAIVGTGAGAGITAEILCRAGLKVVLVEEGPLRSSSEFKQLESEAYPALYQDSAARKTADKAINILQGRCVGGSTTVNWTSSFRTPERTLSHWQQQHGLAGFGPGDMAPWFDAIEKRLSIGPWPVPPNRNNAVLGEGGTKLGIPVHAIPRNVRGCWNLGSCGMGCPTNAKQSMLVTTLPTALDAGATLLVQTRVTRIEADGRQARALVAHPVALNGEPDRSRTVRIEARHFVVAGGAINSPALLLRSKLPDPHARVGLRTFLHPVVISAASFTERVEGWNGAPQTLYSDHFLDTLALDGPMGFKLETPPIHPLIYATTFAGYGREQAERLRDLPNTQALLALMRDGFHPESEGGRVRLRDDGSPELDYPINAYLLDGARRALLAMAELQFAAGARHVIPVHDGAGPFRTWAEARAAIQALELRPLATRMVSAHVMGGCSIGADPQRSVVNPEGRHWHLDNLSIHDGSLFPTSIGANPQVSVYALTARLASGLARHLAGVTPGLAEVAA